MGKPTRLTLDRDHMMSMLSDPEFFNQCPEFLWLKDTALKTKELYDKVKKERCCGADWAVFRPVVDAFFNNLKELRELDKKNVQNVRDYLQKKKNRELGEIVIFYRSSKQQARPNRFKF